MWTLRFHQGRRLLQSRPESRPVKVVATSPKQLRIAMPGFHALTFDTPQLTPPSPTPLYLHEIGAPLPSWPPLADSPTQAGAPGRRDGTHAGTDDEAAPAMLILPEKPALLPAPCDAPAHLSPAADSFIRRPPSLARPSCLALRRGPRNHRRRPPSGRSPTDRNSTGLVITTSCNSTLPAGWHWRMRSVSSTGPQRPQTSSTLEWMIFATTIAGSGVAAFFRAA